MNIFQNMRLKKLLALCIGIICIIGCGRTNIRETNNKEVGSREAGMKEAKKDETKIREIIVKEADISPANLLDDSFKEETEKTNKEVEGIKAEAEKKKNDKQSIHYDEVGIASFISDEYDGKMTASGVRYDRNEMTAAHPSLPFDTKILVINLRNKREVEVIIIDRFSPTKDRILNVSHSAAVELDLVESGIAKIGIKIIANPD
jgi:rare lipoprotein A